MLKGCEHCGAVIREGAEDGLVTCRGCGRPLKPIDPYQAQVLMRERRIAEQFRRATRLGRTVDAGRAFGSG